MKIHIVDDDPVQRLIARDAIDPASDEVSEFSDGASFLAGLETPDLLLLDIEMPALDGITTCREFFSNGNDHTAVIFISSHDDLETRLQAYAAGGSDFVVKPFSPEELRLKIETARKTTEQRQHLQQSQQLAQQVAFTAMSSMSEQGVVIQFLQDSFSCTTPEALSSALFKACGQYGLQAIVEISLLGSNRSYGQDGPCTPLEKSILGHARKLERIFRFRSQLSVHYPHITLIASNLPSDETIIGRLRDHLAIILEGANARIAALESEARRHQQSLAILNSAGELTTILAQIDCQQKDNGMRVINLACDYTTELSRAFVHLGLSEQQEQELSILAQTIGDKISEFVEENQQASDQLRTVVGRLRNLSSLH